MLAMLDHQILLPDSVLLQYRPKILCSSQFINNNISTVTTLVFICNAKCFSIGNSLLEMYIHNYTTTEHQAMWQNVLTWKNRIRLLPENGYYISFSVRNPVLTINDSDRHNLKFLKLKHYLCLCKSYPCNRPWRPIGLWDVEAPTHSRQSAHRWRKGQPYAPAALYPPGRFLVLISVRGWVED
jgi:hypothetical protein